MPDEMPEILRRAKAAAAALERGPAYPELAVAPRIDSWLPLVSRSDVPVLWGRVSDHPLLGNDDVVTSRLMGLNLKAGWARTYNRWYVLGTPFAAFEKDLLQSFGGSEVSAGFTFSGFPDFEPLRDFARLDVLMKNFLKLLNDWE